MKVTVRRDNGTTYELTEATHEWLVLAKPTTADADVDIFMSGSYETVANMLDACIRSSPELIMLLSALVVTRNQKGHQEAN